MLYSSEYCTNAETKTVKLDDLMKDLFSAYVFKNPMFLLSVEFMNEAIDERDMNAQDARHLLERLHLTSSSRTVVSLNARILEQLRRDLPGIDRDHIRRYISGTILRSTC